MFHKKKRIYKNIWLVPAIAIALGLSLSSPVSSQPSAVANGLTDSQKYYNPDLLVSYYSGRNMETIWVRGATSFQPRIEAVSKILNDSWTHGLNPAHYRVTEIAELSKNLTAESRLQLDLVISDAVIRYAHDLTGMRGKAQAEEKKLKYWREPLETAQILKMVSDAVDPVAAIRGLEPSYALYQSLQAELVRLSKLPAEDTKPVILGKMLKPGKSNPQVPVIRAKMGLPASDKNANTYDEALSVEIIKLQKRYGLETDGIIGERTLELINLTNDDKMMQIIANMERLRWVGQERPEKYILVNIPSASLWAVNGGEVKLEMPVIVGKTARPTFSFKTEITGVRFNPNWTVPPTIKSEDLLPALRRDPYALQKRGINLKQGGEWVDPTQVNWNTISSRELHSINMVQQPGEDNPLGKVRVIMENPYNIYLHDTNHREMFSKKERNLSSGCIRVSKPEDLANFILSGNDGWNAEKTAKSINSGKMRDIKTDVNIPVYITYQTVWLSTDGRLIYGRDIYGQDKKLAAMLKNSDAIHIPKNEQKDDISL